MIPDAEIVSLLCTILTRLDIGEFTVKVNISHLPLAYFYKVIGVRRLITVNCLMVFSKRVVSQQTRYVPFHLQSTNWTRFVPFFVVRFLCSIITFCLASLARS
jgi:hypothetical protein